MTHLNRRNLIIGGLALPALEITAGAVSAVAASPVDPIFAAIAAHRAAEDEFTAAVNEHSSLDERLPKSVTREPRARMGKSLAVKGEKYWYANSHEKIDEEFSDWIDREHKRMNPYQWGPPRSRVPKLERDRVKAHAAFDVDAQRQKAKQDAAGWTGAEQRVDAAGDAETATSMALAETMPTTLQGMRALLLYAVEYVESGREWPDRPYDTHELRHKDWSFFLHQTLADALGQISAPAV